jgi:hypothetical protein
VEFKKIEGEELSAFDEVCITNAASSECQSFGMQRDSRKQCRDSELRFVTYAGVANGSEAYIFLDESYDTTGPARQVLSSLLLTGQRMHSNLPLAGNAATLISRDQGGNKLRTVVRDQIL